jgi:hypothetical protein
MTSPICPLDTPPFVPSALLPKIYDVPVGVVFAPVPVVAKLFPFFHNALEVPA